MTDVLSVHKYLIPTMRELKKVLRANAEGGTVKPETSLKLLAGVK